MFSTVPKKTKRCPECQQTFSDDLKFCRSDGTLLESLDNADTEIFTKRFVASTEPPIPKTTVLNKSPGPIAGAKTTGDPKPETKYAKSGDIHIAYQVLGEGPLDLIYVPGWVTHIEYGWEEPSLANFYRRLASFSRLILFDKRGTGLSDQSTNMPTMEQRMDDVRAVMEAAGSERAVVFGTSEGGNMAILFAATYPERTIALITFGVFAKRVYDPEYPWAPTPEERQKFFDAIQNEWGGPCGIEDIAPSRAQDEQFRNWWASYQRHSASPGGALKLARLNTAIDVRHVLPAIRVPTLVMHRINDRDANVEEGRYIASHIPNATFAELPGQDHIIFVGDQDPIFKEVEDFVANVGRAGEVDSVLATVLTVISANAKPHSLQALQALAKREAEWFRGRVAEVANTEFCATFDGPIRSIRCARAIRDGVAGIPLEVRVGLHTGLCEIRGSLVSGKAIDMSKLVAERAEPGRILLTNTVMDLVSGSDVSATNEGVCRFEGLAQECSLFALI